MENNVGLKSSWAAAFAVASVWFGTHVGGGFATGNQVISYFVQYGVTGIIWPLLSMGLLAFIMYVVARFARLRGLTNYKDTFCELYPNPKMEILFEIFYVVIILAAVAAAVSGAAELLEKYFALPRLLSRGIVIAMLVLLSIFGIKLIMAVSSFLSAAILVIVAVMFVVGLANAPQSIGEAVAATPVNNAAYAFFRGVPVYAAFQCVSIPSFIAASTTVTNNKGVKKSAILGGLMNGLALAASACMLLTWFPMIDAAGERGLPNLFVCNQIGWSWLTAVYSVLLFCAFVSTSVTLVYSMIDRFQGKLPTSVPEKGRKVIVGVIVIALCFAVSLLGLSTIISKVYGYCGYYGIVVIIIPVLVWGISKNKKWVAEHPECLDD